MDHGTWTSPERMDPNRPSFKIDAARPGSDVAGETAAAMTCGYLAFKTKGKICFFGHLEFFFYVCQLLTGCRKSRMFLKIFEIVIFLTP